MKSEDITIGEIYKFKGETQRLKYIGYNYSGNGYWHQFEKEGEQGVWSGVLDDDLWLIEVVESEVEPQTAKKVVVLGSAALGASLAHAFAEAAHAASDTSSLMRKFGGVSHKSLDKEKWSSGDVKRNLLRGVLK